MPQTDPKLRALFARVFRIPAENLPASIDTESVASWDSLTHLELIDQIEHEFGVELSQAEAVMMLSEAEIMRVLAGKQHGKIDRSEL
jgi:acyl carrier protein